MINIKGDPTTIYGFAITVLEMATRSPNFGGKNGTHFFSQRVCQKIT